jgi:hypothetical protein
MLCGSGIPVSDGARCFPSRNAALKYLRSLRPFSVLGTYTLKLINVDAMSTGSVRGGVDDCVITIYAQQNAFLCISLYVCCRPNHRLCPGPQPFLGLCAGVAQTKSGRQYFWVLGFTAGLMIQFAFPRNCLPILVDNSFADNFFVEIAFTVLWLFDEGVV